MQKNNLIYELVKSQWDSIANNEPFPHFPSKQKHLVGKWRCKKGHFWYETIEKRAYYQKSHMCQTKRRVTEVHNLQYLRHRQVNFRKNFW